MKNGLVLPIVALMATYFVTRKKSVSGIGAFKENGGEIPPGVDRSEYTKWRDACDLATLLRDEKSAGNRVLRNYVIKTTGNGVFLTDKRTATRLNIHA